MPIDKMAAMKAKLADCAKNTFNEHLMDYLPEIKTMVGGEPVKANHREIKDNGQQKGYVVLSKEERDKGFIRKLRRTYTHKTCGKNTTIHSDEIAETFAREPTFYSGTFCASCREHFALNEFKWINTDEMVGT